MASAGRILIIPRGDYDANSTYEKLDLVKYKGTSWLAKKNATGVEPSEANAEFWQNMFDIKPSEMQNRLSVTIPEGTESGWYRVAKLISFGTTGHIQMRYLYGGYAPVTVSVNYLIANPYASITQETIPLKHDDYGKYSGEALRVVREGGSSYYIDVYVRTDRTLRLVFEFIESIELVEPIIIVSEATALATYTLV
jgi:hypothetical protein